MSASLLGPVLIGSFIACSVEVIEMVIIVVGVGVARGWRSTIIGALSGLTILAAIVLGLGQALQLVPIDTLRIAIGGLLLTFGLQWLTKGVVGVAADGFSGAVAEEEDTGDDAPAGGAIDWTAWLLAFKGVLLEGLEVAFIVIAFGAGGGGSGNYTAAYIGAGAAFVVIGTVGVLATGTLEQVPGRVLKFGVGGLLSTFGTFWAMEGLGVSWPGKRLSLAGLYAIYLSATFVLAALAHRGILGPAPIPSEPADAVPGSPVWAAPVDDATVRHFQQVRGLEPTGAVDDPTRAAIMAERAEQPDHDDVSGVDPADPASVQAFQSGLGLPASGELDAMTMGALRAARLHGLVDPGDPDAVRGFQRSHGLDPTGRLDDETGAALRAVLDAQPGGAVEAFLDLDILSEESVRRFQRGLGIDDDGILDDETRGAARALRRRLHDLGAEDGEAAQQPPGRLGATPRAGEEPDPLDADEVRRFQRRYGLRDDGIIGPSTREALRWEHEHLLGLDVSSPESVRAFQRGHGLRDDGIVGPVTQAAMLSLRRQRQLTGPGGSPEDRYGDARDHAAGFGIGLDPTDADSIRTFQQHHGLTADGVIGPRTQAALRALRGERSRPTHRS